MKVGKEITQEQANQIRQAITDHLTVTQGQTPEGSEALNLITGMSQGLWNTLLQALLAQISTWVQDPNNIQLLVKTILGMFIKTS